MKETPERTAAREKANHSAAHTALSKAIQQYLDGIGAWSANIAGSKYQRAGLPDFIGFVWHPLLKVPVFFAIEVKTGKGVLRADQKIIRAEIEQCRGVYVLAHSVDEVHDRFRAESMVLIDLLVR